MGHGAQLSASVSRQPAAHQGSERLRVLSQVAEVLASPGQRAAGRFIFAYVRDVTKFAASREVQEAVCYSIDAELVSFNFTTQDGRWATTAPSETSDGGVACA